MIRRIFRRLHQWWFDGDGDGDDDDVRGAYRFTRRLVRQLGMIEDPRIRREFDEIERELRALQRKRSGR